MIDVLLARLHQGHRTQPFPATEPALPERFRGRPEIDSTKCGEGCSACVQSCPTKAISGSGSALRLDLGRCLFCNACQDACPAGAIKFTRDYRLAVRKREELITDGKTLELAKAVDGEARRLFGRSLQLREVSAAGCNACEADTNVLGTPGFDLGRFGIRFVASPRHADGLLITGPVSVNMKLALEKTYAAVPSPKLVIVVGACAISGGPYVDHPEALNGAAGIVPVDLFIPGCPPHPYTILDGLLRLLARRG
jgi:Ni,Fe-hydrogenase III small subunit/NAD-dependent dihydropyrimidine dehydrogenase PreA subunit